ncbi:hypothetical protein BGZ65_008930, partial [Modicella reniformis]
MTVEDFGTAIGLTSQTLQPIDPSRVGDYMKQALESLAEALEMSSNLRVSRLEVLPPDERALLLYQWNSTMNDYPQQKTIHSLFEDQVGRTPKATAVVFLDQSLTYAELNARANRLAHHLIGLGVQPDMRVAICVERSFAMIIGVLAILKAGGAYVPLDPVYASKRLRGILTDATPSIVVADESGRKILGEGALSNVEVVDPNTVFDVDHESTRSRDESVGSDPLDSNPQVPGLTSHHLAYVIYTSGSTGKPKGVLIEHQGVVNLIHGRPEMFGILHSSRVLQFTSLGFDHSVSEIFSTLSFGASLHLIRDDVRLDRNQLWDYLLRRSITHVSLTPALLQDIKGLPTLNTLSALIVMGEAFPVSLIPPLRQVAPHCTIINDYGPTETSVATIDWSCPPDFSGDVVPIGQPTANKRAYILDKYGQPVPLGTIGELYIGGVGVARGYLNRPELTAKAFLPDPFAVGSDARMYKTGDLARYLPDGSIVFLGRNDHQVKIRGFRIELEEIEARLVDHTMVDKAAVIAMGEGNDKRLVAYVIAKPDDQLVHSLRTHLSSSLPEYMVPAAIVRLDALPLNSNGKLDRKALPAPDSSAFARLEYEEPQGEIESRVAHIWAELLHLDRVSRNDNFFALGGHSLLAVQLIERLRRTGLTLSVSALFKTPTLSILAESLSELQEQMVPSNLITPDTKSITPEILPLVSVTQSDIDRIVNQVPSGVANIQDIYSLSPLQE